MSNASDPFVPLISHWNALRWPCAKRVASSVPTEPFSNVTAASAASSTCRPCKEGVSEPLHGRQLTVQEPRQVDGMGHQIAQRAGACHLAVEPPRVECRVVAPVLQVPGAEVADLAQLAGVDHLARQPHCRHEPVVEAAQVLYAGGGHGLPDVIALGRVSAQRLLADDVLPARAAAMVGSACEAFGPPLSNRPMDSSATRSRQSSVP